MEYSQYDYGNQESRTICFMCLFWRCDLLPESTCKVRRHPSEALPLPGRRRWQGPIQVASAASPPRTHGGTAGGSSSPQPAARAAEAPPPGRPKAQEEEPQGQRQRTRQTNPSPVIALPQSKCQRRLQIQFLLPLPVRPNRAKGSQRAAPLV